MNSVRPPIGLQLPLVARPSIEPRPRRRMGVRVLLFVSLSASAGIPVSLFGLDQSSRWGKNELDASDRQASAAARAAADQLSLAMLSYVRAAETFAAECAGQSSLDVEHMRRSIAAHTRHHPEFIGSYIADAHGKSVLSERDGHAVPSGTDYSDREYYRELVRTRRTVVSDAFVGRTTGVLSVQIVAPILDAGGDLLGFTCSSVNLSGISEQAKGAVHGMAEGRLVAVDGTGRRIADSAADAVSSPEQVAALPLFARVSTSGAELRVAEDDRHQLVRGVALNLSDPVSSWRVVAMTPQWAIDRHALEVKKQTIELVCLAVLVALLLSALLAAWLARPLRALATTADAITRGDLDSLPEMPARGPHEMVLLTQAVRSMIVGLREHARELEQKVQERTSELSSANAELSGALATIRGHQRERDADIEKARLFQAKLLPSLPDRSQLDVAVHYSPLARVGGDIYDVQQLRGGAWRIFLADAVGHGVQASMRTLLLKSVYDRLKLEADDPSQLLSALNAYLVAAFPDGELHCTACCADIQVSSSGATVLYANAGGPPLYVRSPGRALTEVYREGPLLGVDVLEWAPAASLALGSGELLILASDGLGEQQNQARERFDERLARLLPASASNAQATLDEIRRHFTDFVGDQPIADDVTVLVLGAPVAR